MKSFYAYLPDGQVISSGTCKDDELHLQSFPGAKIAEGLAVFGKHYLDSKNKAVDIPASPDAHHKFDYTSKKWVAKPEIAWLAAKEKRTKLLSDSDWVVIKAQEESQKVSPEWVKYRKELRDITLQADPWKIVWPVEPVANSLKSN